MRLHVVVLLAAVLGCRPPGYGKEDPRPDAAEGSGSGSATADAAIDTPPAALTCSRTFRIDNQMTATSVWLTGSFVAWATTPGAGAIAFTQGTDGAWTGSYDFPAGTHQYKFLVDGSNWILDPTNPNTADDGMGHTNSVFTCVP